jgi:hypothetical protein
MNGSFQKIAPSSMYPADDWPVNNEGSHVFDEQSRSRVF